MAYLKIKAIKEQKRTNRLLTLILERMVEMAGELDALQLEVQEISGVVDSAIVLLQGLSQYIRDHANDPTALTNMAQQLDAKAGALAEAINTNTVPGG